MFDIKKTLSVQVIEQSSLVTEQFLAGVEAVEAAARRVSEAEKDEEKAKATQSKTDLHRYGVTLAV